MIDIELISRTRGFQFCGDGNKVLSKVQIANRIVQELHLVKLPFSDRKEEAFGFFTNQGTACPNTVDGTLRNAKIVGQFFDKRKIVNVAFRT